MRDRFTEAVEEMEVKSPFVCASCEKEPHEIAKGREELTEDHAEGLHDRFSEAVEESAEKSAFVCESCRH